MPAEGAQVRATAGSVVLVGLPSQRSPRGRGPVELAAARGETVPCAALPGRTPAAVHLDGACRCFFGGPPPVTL